jgi:dTDP-4-amino-4,6-dideoxygalactose transaminase
MSYLKYKYPLQRDNFSLWDRLKACFFILNKNNRLTCGPKTKELEAKWKAITGSEAIATSSGSTANHLLVETFIQTVKVDPNRIIVFVPSTTWSSSVTPWIMRGCEVVFVDINLHDFSFNYEQLEKRVRERQYEDFVKVIWPTALIGSVPDVNKLNKIKNKVSGQKTFLFGDFCEATIGKYNDKHCISHFDMATTSFFWAHEICGIELGMLFVNAPNSPYVNTAHTVRGHGLSRVLPSRRKRLNLEIEHNYIDKEFLFVSHGSNYRPSDLNSFFCLMDSERYSKYEQQRKEIWKYFLQKLPNKYIQIKEDMIPFCLPFIAKPNTKLTINDVKQRLNDEGWETRPIISFLPLNPAFINYQFGFNTGFVEPRESFPNSNYLHENGFYVGLNPKVAKRDIDELMEVVE